MNDATLLFATYFASADYKMYRYVTDYVEKFTGIPSFLLNGEELDDFSLGYIDAGFIATSDYAYLAAQVPNPVERIATAVLRETLQPCEGLADGKIKIIVRRECSCQDVTDLQESIFSYCFRGHTPDEEVYSREQILQACNTCPLSVKAIIETSSYTQALRLVVDGEADAAIIEARVLDLILRNSTHLAKELREIGSYNISKAADVVVSTLLDASVKQKLREAFRTIHLEPLFAQLLHTNSVERFQVIEPDHRALERAGETQVAVNQRAPLEVCMI